MNGQAGLFRAEVFEQQRTRLWGEVSVRTPVTTRVLTLVCIGIVGIVLSWLALGDYQRKAQVRGVLRAPSGALRVRSESVGVVAAVLVRAGERVRAGQPLVRLRNLGQLPDGGAADGLLLGEIDRQLQEVDSTALRERERDALHEHRLRARRSSLLADIDGMERGVERSLALSTIARAQFDRVAALGARGQLPPAQVEAAQAELLLQLQNAAAVRAQLRSQRNELEDAQLELRQLPLDADNRAAERARRASELRQRRIEIAGARATSIGAPLDGQIKEIYVAPGERVAPDRPLLSLARGDDALEAVLLVPSRAAGFIRTGQTVRLRYDAFPFQRFGTFAAVVTSIDTALQLPAEIELPLLVQEPVLRVRARLHAQAIPAYGAMLSLRPGLAFDADVQLERRSLLQWLFDPLRARLGR